MPTSRIDSSETDRLHWQCRRGMLELDELFKQFLQTGYKLLESSDKSIFTELLKESDPDLYRWLLVGEQCPAQYEFLMAKIKQHK